MGRGLLKPPALRREEEVTVASETTAGLGCDYSPYLPAYKTMAAIARGTRATQHTSSHANINAFLLMLLPPYVVSQYVNGGEQ